MKKFLLAVAVLVSAVAVQAQSVLFYYDGQVLEDGYTLTATNADIDAGTIDLHFGFQNTTAENQEFFVMIQVVENRNADFVTQNKKGKEIPAGDAVSFCVPGQCFGPETTESPVYALAPNELLTEGDPFHATFTANSYIYPLAYGQEPKKDSYAEVTYYIMNVNDEDDITTLNVVYDFASALASVESNTINADLKVMQRGENVVFNYAFDQAATRNIVVSNIVGACVANVALNDNYGEVVLERLPKGVYVYTLVENGRNVKSYKFIAR